MTNETGTACAHLTVRYRTKQNEDNSTSGWWECLDCERRFGPLRPVSEVARIADQLTRIADALEEQNSNHGEWTDGAWPTSDDEPAEPVAVRGQIVAIAGEKLTAQDVGKLVRAGSDGRVYLAEEVDRAIGQVVKVRHDIPAHDGCPRVHILLDAKAPKVERTQPGVTTPPGDSTRY